MKRHILALALIAGLPVLHAGNVRADIVSALPNRAHTATGVVTGDRLLGCYAKSVPTGRGTRGV